MNQSDASGAEPRQTQGRHRRNTSALTIEIDRELPLPENTAAAELDRQSGLPPHFSLARQDTLASLFPPSTLNSPLSPTGSAVSLIPHGTVVDASARPSPEAERRFTDSVAKTLEFSFQQFFKGVAEQGAATGTTALLTPWAKKLLTEGIEAAMTDPDFRVRVGAPTYGVVAALTTAYALFSWTQKHSKPLISIIGDHDISRERINQISFGIAAALTTAAVGSLTTYGAIKTDSAASLLTFASGTAVATGVRELATEAFRGRGIEAVAITFDEAGEQQIVPVKDSAKRQLAININYTGLSLLALGLLGAMAAHSHFALAEIPDVTQALIKAAPTLAVVSAFLEGADYVSEHLADKGINVFRQKFLEENAQHGYSNFEIKREDQTYNVARFASRWRNRYATSFLLGAPFSIAAREHAYGVYVAMAVAVLFTSPAARTLRTFANFGADVYEKAHPNRPHITRPESTYDDIALGVISPGVLSQEAALVRGSQQQSAQTTAQQAIVPSSSTSAQASQMEGGNRISAISYYDGAIDHYFRRESQEVTHDVQVERAIVDHSDVNAKIFIDLERRGLYGNSAAPLPSSTKVSKKPLPKFPAATCNIPAKGDDVPELVRDIRQRGVEFFNGGKSQSDAAIEDRYKKLGKIVVEATSLGGPALVTADSVTRTVYCESPKSDMILKISAERRPPGVGVEIGKVLPKELKAKLSQTMGDEGRAPPTKGKGIK